MQSERLRSIVNYVYENRHLPSRLDAAGVSPTDIDGIPDISSLPMTTKEDFEDVLTDSSPSMTTRSAVFMPPLARPGSRRSSATSRTTWSVEQTIARSLSAAGLDPTIASERLRLRSLYRWPRLSRGRDELGATVVPASGGGTQRQVELAADLGTDVLACTPSYALYLAETAEEMGYPPLASDFGVSALHRDGGLAFR